MSRSAETVRFASRLTSLGTSRLGRASLISAIAMSLSLISSSTIFTSTALASCGDYVMVGGHHPATADSQAQPDQSSPAGHSPSGTLGVTRHSAPAAPCKCNGPQCSQAPANVPPAAPSTTNLYETNQWACVLAGGQFLAFSFDRVNSQDAVPPQEGYPDSIDHPPRILA